MENHFTEKDLVGDKARFMALTYTHLTSLFSDLYLHEQAIYFGKKALEFYDNYNVQSWHKAWMLDELGSQYDILRLFDSADYYYTKALEIMQDTTALTFRDIESHRVYLSYSMTQDGETSIKEMYSLLCQAETNKEYLARCLCMGSILYHEKYFDSAQVYLSKVYKNTENIGSKKQAAEWLVEICKAQGKDSEIIEYADFLVPFANQEENKSEIKSQLIEIYNLFKQKELNQKHQQVTKRNFELAITVVGTLFFITLIVIVLYRKNMKRQRNLEVQMEATQYAHEMQQKALSGRLKKSNETLREALKKIENQEQEAFSKNNGISKEKYEIFLQTPICREILDMVNRLHADNRNALKTNSDIKEFKSFALSKSQLASFAKTIETYFPNLFASLKALYPALDRKDWLYCCLYLLQLDKLSICVLLQESYQSCRRRTMKLEHELNATEDIASFLIKKLIS